MKVRLLKKMERKLGADFPIGKVIDVPPSLGRGLIAANKAVEYTDGLPVKKLKSEFFKPK
jgi:hypothetical protein